MRSVKAALLALVLCLVPTLVQASGWSYQAASNGLFTYSNTSGNDGWYYTRTRYRSGCCNYYYRYKKYSRIQQATQQVGYTAGTENWRTKLLEIKSQQALYQQRMKESANEHNEFMEAVKELGLSGGYGAYTPRYANAGVTGLASSGFNFNGYGQSPYANQGNTIYGYTELSEVYGKLDLALHLNQAARLAEGAQSLSSQAVGGYNTLVDNVQEGQQEVAKIVATGQAAAQALNAQGTAATQALRAAQPERPDVQRKQSFFFKVVPDGNGNMKAQMLDNEPVSNQAAATASAQDITALSSKILQNRCGACHIQKSEGGFDLNKSGSFTSQTWDKVMDRLRSPDPEKRMPLAADHSPGNPLPLGEYKTLQRFILAVQAQKD
jgi:hypothetical protein